MTLAYWCILIAILLPWLCAIYAKKLGGFEFRMDNQHPRQFLAKLEGVAARANATQQNSFEILPAFIAAVLIAQATGGASQLTINFWSILFILSRLIYIWAYIKNIATLRSIVWAFGGFCIFCLFIAAI